MRAEIKIVDDEYRFINWKRIDDLSMRYLRTTLILNAVIYSSVYLYKGLALLWGI